MSETTRCPHGIAAPVACPVCEPALYERARPQAEATAKRIADRQTTDLVAHLRGAVDPDSVEIGVAALCNEAADEITRLRNGLREIMGTFGMPDAYYRNRAESILEGRPDV